MNNVKIDIYAPHLVGKYFELNEEGTEFKFPPTDQHVVSMDKNVAEKELTTCHTDSCDGAVKISEEGNAQYAWFYLTNSSDRYAGVTIERRWFYQNEYRIETVRHRLYPGQHKEAFSFPRNQSPACCIVACNIE